MFFVKWKTIPVKIINGRLLGVMLFAALDKPGLFIFNLLIIAIAWLLVLSGSLLLLPELERVGHVLPLLFSLFYLHKEGTCLPYSLFLLPIVKISTLGEMLPLIPGAFYHIEVLANLYRILSVLSGCSPGIHTLGSHSPSITHSKLIYWVMTCAQIYSTEARIINRHSDLQFNFIYHFSYS